MPEGTAETTDIFEIMHTMRAMRRLKPDPVPDELIRKILLAGQAAAPAEVSPSAVAIFLVHLFVPPFDLML